ncbi:MAG: anti-sigma factor [Phycisphaerales bacterium]
MSEREPHNDTRDPHNDARDPHISDREHTSPEPTPDEWAEALALAGMTEDAPLPEGLAAALEAQGRAAMHEQGPQRQDRIEAHPFRPIRAPWALLGLAAVVVVAAGVGLAVLAMSVQGKNARITELQTQLAQAREQAQSNEAFLAQVRQQLDAREDELDDAQSALAAAEGERLQLAERLARATSDLEDAQLRIARLEEPVDPATLAANRQKLLEVPGTVRLAWSPFDLPEAPAVQQDVTGDVVWNDELEQGYLRFVGLKVNDPAVEQYQVWVIDDRGMEQKVSGGVFNATAEGEVIVPIDPALDIGRVALFAVTVEEPGGIMVPDLRRRVVVAPRGEG